MCFFSRFQDQIIQTIPMGWVSWDPRCAGGVFNSPAKGERFPTFGKRSIEGNNFFRISKRHVLCLGSFSGWVLMDMCFSHQALISLRFTCYLFFHDFLWEGNHSKDLDLCIFFGLWWTSPSHLHELSVYQQTPFPRKEEGGSRVPVPLVYTGVCFETSFTSIFLADDLCHNLLKFRSFWSKASPGNSIIIYKSTSSNSIYMYI